MVSSHELRQKFLDFFKAKGHTIIPSASLLPENDPTVLFTTAGMHPLVPYLLGEEHPGGKRLANIQKCIRTGDIDEVGDNRHLTFFEMLGNWSFGDYFKTEAIAWSFEFLTSKSWLDLNPAQLYVSVFAGDKDAPRDEESIKHWQAAFANARLSAGVGDYQQGINEEQRIFTYDKSKNWWGPAGQTGPCGPDTEMFYDILNLPDKKQHASGWSGHEPCHPNCDCGRYVEIWNDVFMEYNKKVKSQPSSRAQVVGKSPPEADPPLAGKVKNDEEVEYEFVPLKQKNVDTGMGLERTLAVLKGQRSVFDTELFKPMFDVIGLNQDVISEVELCKARVVIDHARAAVFMVSDGVEPSNKDRGYVLRRLLRRAMVYARLLNLKEHWLKDLVGQVVTTYAQVYPELVGRSVDIFRIIKGEEEKFEETLDHGLNYFKKQLPEIERIISVQLRTGGRASGPGAAIQDLGKLIFDLYQNYGFPYELAEEQIAILGYSTAKTYHNELRESFECEFKKHQELSRTASAGMFKGGLADHSEEVVKLHTATHLLHQALRDVLGGEVAQKGSNITAERLRFDFVYAAKMSPAEIMQVEQIVNDKIKQDLPVHFELLSVAEAKTRGAIGLFEYKYSQLGNKIKVYFVGDYSAEICGGPHVEHTGQIGSFRILKEEAVAAGVRRIKAVVKV
ncbi:MAG: alanine--tRNA ligase [Candidatus Kerfeldbacteria bacterium]|nr:alanine--tRNA ligase [Candidatus Kerfeldbacteria bacterium]